MEELSPLEKRVLIALGQLGGTATPDDIVAKGGFKQLVEVMNASSWLQSKGLVRHEETIRVFYSLGKEGQDGLKKGLPERRALQVIADNGGAMPLPALQGSGALEPGEAALATGWLKRKDLAQITKGPDGASISLTDKGRAVAAGARMPDEVLLADLASGERPESELDAEGVKIALQRQNLIKKRDEITRVIHVTKKGSLILERGLEVKEEVSQITPDLITSGRWREVEIRPYDVKAFAPTAVGGKKHPLRQVIDEIRQIFLEMGFTEIEGPYVRTAFADMDMLFVPQEHPAREMQDTFYLARPEAEDLSRSPYLKKVKEMHEHGGRTGSRGWGSKWSESVAAQYLLRTHTTVDTINYLAKHPDPPVKVFSVDRVFRNESIDATHLPEFHQVEGIVMEEGANLRMLIGLLREFYRKMGATDVRVRPAYFPYTEPSLEVEVFYNNRWMELGGAGIFRKEVTEPVGVKHPVLAWGLGLERLAMMRLGLKDLRDLYISDVEWLRDAPLVASAQPGK